MNLPTKSDCTLVTLGQLSVNAKRTGMCTVTNGGKCHAGTHFMLLLLKLLDF